MKSDWKTDTIENICVRICSGGTPSRKHPEYYLNGSIPWLNTSEIDFSRIYKTENKISSIGLKNSSAKWIPTNAVIVAMYGATAGKVAISGIPLTTNQACCNLIIDEKYADYRYVYYYLCHNYIRLSSLANGGAQQNLSVSLLKNFQIVLPKVEIQKKIAAILSALDEKIAINRAINENLERQAKEYFKSLFIDFAAYNGEFVDSPIGLIPATMEIDQISNIPHTLETGKRPKGGAVEKGVPSIGAENVKQLGVVDFSSAKFIPEEFAFSMKRGRIYGYEVLLYKDGGKPGTFIPHFSMFGEGFPYETCFINEHVFKLDFGHRGYNEFCYLYLQTDYPFHWLANNGGKAAVPGINQQDVNDIWIPTIHNESVKKFCEWVQPIFTTILSNCSENVKLANIRDSLLSRLLSGEIDVSEIEF